MKSTQVKKSLKFSVSPLLVLFLLSCRPTDPTVPKSTPLPDSDNSTSKEPSTLTKSTPAPDPEITKRFLEIESKARSWDQIIWKPEIEALKHEEVFIRFWDALRRKNMDFELAATFPFQEFLIPDPGSPVSMENGIQEYRFLGSPISISRKRWHALLNHFQSTGYQLQQSEWRHARFDPAGNTAAESLFWVSLHLLNKSLNLRAAFEGELKIEWFPADEKMPNSYPKPRRVELINARMKTQNRLTGFRQVMEQDVGQPLAWPLILYDLNRDGLSEIILGRRNRILWNRGQFRFEEKDFLDIPPESLTHTSLIADFNHDGFPDYICVDLQGLLFYPGTAESDFSSSPIRCFTPESGMLMHPFVLTTGDVDGDNDLDLFLGQYRAPYRDGQMPTPYYDALDGYPSFLLMNQGNAKFSDATLASGLEAKRNRRTYSASFIDLDQDSDLDLVIVSDFAGVDVYENNGKGKFVDVTESKIDEPHVLGMALRMDDFNKDGWMDLFVVGMNSYAAERLSYSGLGPDAFPKHQRMRPIMTFGNRLYFGNESGFQMGKVSLQVARTGWSWGITSLDYDNDTDLDMYIANGHQSRQSVREYESHHWRFDIYAATSQPDPAMNLYFQSLASRVYGKGTSYGGFEKNRFFINQEGKSFLEAGFLEGVGLEHDCRNAISNDLDGDGRMDLVVMTSEVWPETRQRLLLFQNQVETQNHWVGIHLLDKGHISNSPVGAEVIVETPNGRQKRRYLTGDGFRSQHAPTIHFGLGKEKKIISIRIKYIDGSTATYPNPEVDQYHAY